MDDDRTQLMPRLSMQSPMGVSLDGGWVTTTCLASHPLKEFRTFYDGYTCSHCTLAFPKRTTLRGCRKCDYDICRKCDAENAKRTTSLPRHTLSRRSSSRRSSNPNRYDDNNNMEKKKKNNDDDNDDEIKRKNIHKESSDDDEEESVPRSVSAPTTRRSMSPRPINVLTDSDSDYEVNLDDDEKKIKEKEEEELKVVEKKEVDKEDDKDSLSISSFNSSYPLSNKQVSTNRDSSEQANIFNKRMSDITYYDGVEEEHNARQNSWAPCSPRPKRENFVITTIHNIEEEEATLQQHHLQHQQHHLQHQQHQAEGGGGGVRIGEVAVESVELVDESKDEIECEEHDQQQENGTNENNELIKTKDQNEDNDQKQSLPTSRILFPSDDNDQETSSKSVPKLTRRKVKKRPAPLAKRRSSTNRDISPTQNSVGSSSHISSLSSSSSFAAESIGETDVTSKPSSPKSPKPSTPLRRVSSPSKIPRSRSMSASSVLDSPKSPRSRRKKKTEPIVYNSSSPSKKNHNNRQGSFTDVDGDNADKEDEEVGISDKEMEKAYLELKGIVEGTCPKPENVKLLNQGKIGRGGWWTLHGIVDVETGLLQLYLEGHFGVPVSIMERCVLDEEFQKTYDPFLRIKQVIATVGKKKKNNIKSSKKINSNDDDYHIENNENDDENDGRGLEVGSEVFHHEIKFPAPFSNRDYVFYRRKNLEKNRFSYVQRDVMPKSLASQYVQPRKGVIRAGNGKYWQLGMGMEEIDLKPSPMANDTRDRGGKGKGGRDSDLGRCIMVVRSQDNIEGKVPKWLSNLAAKQGAPGYVKQLEKAAIGLMIDEGMVSKADAKLIWR